MMTTAQRSVTRYSMIIALRHNRMPSRIRPQAATCGTPASRWPDRTFHLLLAPLRHGLRGGNLPWMPLANKATSHKIFSRPPTTPQLSTTRLYAQVCPPFSPAPPQHAVSRKQTGKNDPRLPPLHSQLQEGIDWSLCLSASYQSPPPRLSMSTRRHSSKSRRSSLRFVDRVHLHPPPQVHSITRSTKRSEKRTRGRAAPAASAD